MKPINYKLTEDAERLGAYEIGTDQGQTTYINCEFTNSFYLALPENRRKFAHKYEIYLVEKAQGHLIESRQRVHFKDWNRKNFDLDNLAIVTARELHDLKTAKFEEERDKRAILKALLGK